MAPFGFRRLGRRQRWADARSHRRRAGEIIAPPIQTTRIGQFTDSFPPIINGVSAFVAEHHGELLSQGQHAHVFTFRYTWVRDPYPNVWRTAGAPIPTSPFRFNVAPNAAARRAAEQLDVYHAHEAFGIGRIALRMARRRGRPLVFTNHTRHDLYISNYPRPVQPFMRWYAFREIARFMRASAISTAPSDESAQLLRRLAPDVADRVRVVRNGIRLDQFDRPTNGMLRGELGIPHDATVFAYIGQLTPEKNLPAFAGALVRAVSAGADARWIVIGDGACRDALSELVRPIDERVYFFGPVPRERVPDYLAMADVFATPSLSEVNPVSVIEALACSKPYVGVKSAWWNELQPDPSNGSLSAGLLAEDADHLAQLIEDLCRNPTQRAGMSAAAKRLSRRFDIRDTTAQWIEIYAHVAAVQ